MAVAYKAVDIDTGSLPQQLLLVEFYVPVPKQEPRYRWIWYGFYIIP